MGRVSGSCIALWAQEPRDNIIAVAYAECNAALAARPDLKGALQSVERAKINHRFAVASGPTDPTLGMDIAGNPPVLAYFGAGGFGRRCIAAAPDPDDGAGNIASGQVAWLGRPFAIEVAGRLVSDLVMSTFPIPALYVWMVGKNGVPPDTEAQFGERA